MVYEPREDSFLLQKFVKKYAKGVVLDIGTGSGIQAETAAKKPNVDLVLAVDVDKKAIKHCEKNVKSKKVRFLKSNLFQVFEENFVIYDPIKKDIEVIPTDKVKNPKEMMKSRINFDFIVFNPPYLPQDKGIKDKALYGGKKGFETLIRFISRLKKYLKQDGCCTILFSSLTGKKRINDSLKKNGFRYIQVAKEHIFFEDLFVYYITK